MSRKQIAQLIGRVFIQKSAVNLLSTVLDTPEFFWSAPDSMQARAQWARHTMPLRAGAWRRAAFSAGGRFIIGRRCVCCACQCATTVVSVLSR